MKSPPDPLLIPPQRRSLHQFAPTPVFPYCRCTDYTYKSNPYTLNMTATVVRLPVSMHAYGELT